MKLFGTDGIRAPFGTYPLDQETILHLGYRLARVLSANTKSPTVIMGGDTRDSTAEICSWLATGLDAGGAIAAFGGVLPTPAIAALVVLRKAAAGISVSASHNPYPDNGIKLFDHAGFKWTPESEEMLEKLVLGPAPGLPAERSELEIDTSLADQYLDVLRSRLAEENPFAGLRIVLDTANGAGTPFAESLFSDLGAKVHAIGNQPNGRNINERCGSTAPDDMTTAVIANNADFGVAFDGDADRALIADEAGQMRDGDAMLFLWARYLKQSGLLSPSSIVATSMSNLGLEQALGSEDISVVRCDVGDRNVVTTMQEHGISLGGEQSGHLISLDRSTTGDGLSTALQMALIIQESGVSLSTLLERFHRFPQVLRNVRVSAKPALHSVPRVVRAAKKVEESLGSSGRLVLRYSGTEPLARVMIEGQDLEEIDRLAGGLVQTIRDEIGEPQR